jgi:hypothetical protein
LTFAAPSGTAYYTDSIPVVLTLSLTTGTGGLSTNIFGNVIGLTGADINPFLFPNVPLGIEGSDATRSSLNVFYECSGTFTTGCGGPPYDLTFNFIFAAPLTVADGSSTDLNYLFFTPTGGAAPPGRYSFTNTGIIIQVWDDNATDPDDPTQPLHLADVVIAGTRATDANTEFSRDVTATEPATWGLMLSSLAVIGGIMRRNP